MDNSRKHDLLLILKIITDYFGIVDANRTHNSVRLNDKLFCTHNSSSFIEDLSYDSLVELPYGQDEYRHDNVFKMIYDVHRTFYQKTDCNFFIHFHDPAIIAVANTDDGLLPISQESLSIINDVYHKRFTGLFDENLSHDFTDVYNNENKSIILIQGHGGLIMGKTAPEVVLKCYMFIRACRIQALNSNMIKMPAHQFDEKLNNILGNNLYVGFKKHYNGT